MPLSTLFEYSFAFKHLSFEARQLTKCLGRRLNLSSSTANMLYADDMRLRPLIINITFSLGNTTFATSVCMN